MHILKHRAVCIYWMRLWGVLPSKVDLWIIQIRRAVYIHQELEQHTHMLSYLSNIHIYSYACIFMHTFAWSHTQQFAYALYIYLVSNEAKFQIHIFCTWLSETINDHVMTWDMYWLAKNYCIHENTHICRTVKAV